MRGLLTVLLAGSVAQASAQAVSDFETPVLTQAASCYIDPNPTGTTKGFTSGDAEFMHTFTDYGGGFILWEGFTYSNYTDSIGAGSFDWQYQVSARTAKGYNGSAQYATAYAYSPSKIRLKNSAQGRPVAGFQIANTTWCYNHVNDSYQTGDWVKLTVKGYSGGALKNDSVVYYLADLRSPNTANHTNLRGWEWVNLLPLGNVDSLWFRVTSSDDIAPAYFCMDNLTPLANCDDVTGLDTLFVHADTAGIHWAPSATAVDYEYAITQSATPPANGTVTTDTLGTKGSLLALTAYYGHVRSNCGNGVYSAWQTKSFTTPSLPPATGIDNYNKDGHTVLVYPNPASHMLHIKSREALYAAIYSTDGRLQLQSAPAASIDISQLPQGLYQLQLRDASGVLRHHTTFSKTR